MLKQLLEIVAEARLLSLKILILGTVFVGVALSLAGESQLAASVCGSLLIAEVIVTAAKHEMGWPGGLLQ